MRKLAIITVMVSMVAVLVCYKATDAAQDEKATVAQAEGTASTAVQKRRAWRKFKREHPEQARMMMNICKQNPELGCGAMMGIGPALGKGPKGRGEPGRMGRMEQTGPGEEPGEIRGREGPRHAAAPEFAEQMKELRALKQEVRKLGMEYQAASDTAKKKKLEKTINKKLNQVYELKREVMHKRVEMVEQRLNRVKQQLEKYEKDRDGVIKAWFERVTEQTAYKEF